jgi:hypothetical protein
VEAFLTRSRTRPSEELSSKITTRITRWATIEMWMLSFSPSWKRIENSFSPMRRRQAVGGGHVARGERGQRGGVEVLDVAVGGDLLAVLVDEEDDLGVGVDSELRDDLLDLVELLLVHDDVGRGHSVILL